MVSLTVNYGPDQKDNNYLRKELIPSIQKANPSIQILPGDPNQVGHASIEWEDGPGRYLHAKGMSNIRLYIAHLAKGLEGKAQSP